MSTEAAAGTVLTDDTSMGALGRSLHLRYVVERELKHCRMTSWPTEATRLEAFEQSARYVSRDNHEREVWLGDPVADGGWSMHVALGNGQVSVQAASADPLGLDRLLAEVLDACPRTEQAPDDPRVPMTFWSLGPHGPVGRSRMIDVPSWEDIAGNYPAGLGGQLARLTGPEFTPGVSGQLVLWHGPPGTGKTWALRALAWEWRSWCDVHYVTDPEIFFGTKAGYMLDVLLHEDDMAPAPSRADAGDDEEALEVDPRAADGRWRLLICEDTGELLARDAKDRTGQGLSRLLNVVDGLLGQGLRILVLITTNEVLKDLHPAVQRPGRCAAQLAFGSFDLEEAREWLRGVYPYTTPPLSALSGKATIAELYEFVAGHGLRPAESPPVGFAGRA